MAPDWSCRVAKFSRAACLCQEQELTITSRLFVFLSSSVSIMSSSAVWHWRLPSSSLLLPSWSAQFCLQNTADASGYSWYAPSSKNCRAGDESGKRLEELNGQGGRIEIKWWSAKGFTRKLDLLEAAVVSTLYSDDGNTEPVDWTEVTSYWRDSC